MRENAPLVLVARQERARRLTSLALRHGGFDVKVAGSVDQAAGVVRRHRVLGVVTVDEDPPASEEIRDLRTRTDAPIVVVSGHSETLDRVALLDAGADDVIAYPYDVEEFLARVRAAMRRFERANGDEPPIVTDDFTVHLADRRFVRADGTDAPLSPTEWRVVEVLLRRAGHLVGHEEILRAVWGEAALKKPGLLRVHLASIRHKVEPNPAEPRYFVTAPGLGIRFVPSMLEARGSAS